MSTSFIIENGILQSVLEDSIHVSIPEEVVRIGKGAFKGKKLTTITFLGSNLKSVDDEAFMNCTQLESVDLPNGIVQIGDRAFLGCLSLRYIVVPDSVVVVGEDIIENRKDDFVVVGEDIIENRKNDFVIIGKPDTEADAIAKTYHVALRTDKKAVVEAIEKAIEIKKNITTKTFEIFGERVTCSSSITLYHSNLEYYSKRKDVVFNEIYNALIRRTGGDAVSIVARERDNIVNRLSETGVFIQRESISLYIVDSFEAVCEALSVIFEAFNIINKDVNDSISDNRERLFRDAESKITGLNYGIIGSRFDLMLYDLDDIRERKYQRKQAYEEVRQKDKQFRQEKIAKANQLYNDFIDKAVPTLQNVISAYMDDLCKAENVMLTRAGLISDDIEKTIDIEKSAQIIQNIANKGGDNRLSVALALKKYPCNVVALVYAIEHSYTCQELTDLICFLKFENILESAVSKSKEKRVSAKLEYLKTVTNSNTGVDAIKKDIDFLDELEIRELLYSMVPLISSSVEKILIPENNTTIKDIQAYCSNLLNSIITPDTWNFFRNYGVSPIKSQIIKETDSYEELKKWLCDQLESKINEKELSYLYLKEQLAKAKNRSDYEKLAPLFKECEDYKDAATIYSTIQETIHNFKKKKARRILLTIAIGTIALCTLILYIKNTPYRELNQAIASGSFSAEWAESNIPHHIYDDKTFKIIAKELSKYHSEDNAESAMYLLSDVMELGFSIDGEYHYATSSFIDWIKDAAISKGTKVCHEWYYEYEEYELFGVLIRWKSGMMMNQFYLYVPSEDEWHIVTTDNPFYKIDRSDKVEIK